jgi:cardiolipin-specific phospholipase
VHGYGAGGGVFYRVFKDLSLYFHIYVIDLLGMGSSGRPEYTASSVELAEDFFVQSIKIFKEKICLSGPVYFAGHSLGGYVAAVYALRHPEDVIKLILLSPVGLPEKPDTFTHQEVVERFDSWKGKAYAKAVLYLWEKNFTPFGPMRASGSWGTKAFLNLYLKNRMSSITVEDELREMKRYLHQIFLRPPSGEYSINTILSPGSYAKKPLFDRI